MGDIARQPRQGDAREYTLEIPVAIRERAEALGLTQAQALEHLGETTSEVYLNESGSWRSITYALDQGGDGLAWRDGAASNFNG